MNYNKYKTGWFKRCQLMMDPDQVKNLAANPIYDDSFALVKRRNSGSSKSTFIRADLITFELIEVVPDYISGMNRKIMGSHNIFKH